jgi:hypothetical protein
MHAADVLRTVKPESFLNADIFHVISLLCIKHSIIIVISPVSHIASLRRNSVFNSWDTWVLEPHLNSFSGHLHFSQSSFYQLFWSFLLGPCESTS